MKGITIMVVSSITGGLGWWLGYKEGLWTGFLLGIAGTAAGVYFTRRLWNEYLP